MGALRQPYLLSLVWSVRNEAPPTRPTKGNRRTSPAHARLESTARRQLDEALAGTHGATIAELITLLDRLELNSAAALLDFVQRSDWSAVSYDIRLTVLHPVNQTISGLCKRSGLVPSDDGLPGDRNNVFRVVRRALLTPSPADAGSPDQGRVGRGVIAAHQIKEVKMADDVAKRPPLELDSIGDFDDTVADGDDGRSRGGATCLTAR